MVWITVVQFLLSLSIMVLLHEMGHFVTARWFKTRVEKFYLFFNPWFSLYKKQIGEVEWGIGWLPLGGYVKISGMVDESFDSEQLKGEPQPWEFRSKPAWQRLIIMLGGIIVNFILGFLIFGLIIFSYGKSYVSNDSITDGIVVDSLGIELGLQDGDHILKVGAEEVEKFSPNVIVNGAVLGDATSVTVRRAGQQITLPITEEHIHMLTKYENQGKRIYDARFKSELGYIAEESIAESIDLRKGDQLLTLNGNDARYFHQFQETFRDNFGNESTLQILRDGDTLSKVFVVEEGNMLGIMPVQPEPIIEKFGLLESLGLGTQQGLEFLGGQISAFGKMFSGKIKAKESLGSFISIGKQFGDTWDWSRFWQMTGMLSLLLGFINLLPIPALDGGHVMFLLIEVITGRKPSDRVLEYATFIGFILVIIFMIYAIGIDIMRHI